LQQVEVAQHARVALEHEHRETQLITHFQYFPENPEFSLNRLVITGEDEIDRGAAQRLAQQDRSILLDLDAISKIKRVIVWAVLFVII